MFSASSWLTITSLVPFSIAAECTAFLGPAGYGYIQSMSFSSSFLTILLKSYWTLASPPQEHITGTEWWTDYQPVSYILTSKRGDQAQFQKYVSTIPCDRARAEFHTTPLQHDRYLPWCWSPSHRRFASSSMSSHFSLTVITQILSSTTWPEVQKVLESPDLLTPCSITLEFTLLR